METKAGEGINRKKSMAQLAKTGVGWGVETEERGQRT